jgi:hypothetical protein
MTESEHAKAAALAAALQALSTGHAQVLAAELVALLERASTAAAGPSSIATSSRQTSQTPSAVRARRRREAQRAAAAQQLDLPAAVATAVDDGRDRGRAACNHSEPGARELARPSQDPDPLPRICRSEDQDPRSRVRHDPERPPLWLLDDAKQLRPDLSEYVLHNMWRRFASKRPWHKSVTDARKHARTWLRRQEVDHAPPPPPPSGLEIGPPCDEKAPQSASDDFGGPPAWSMRPAAVQGPLLTLDDRRAIAKAQALERLDLWDEPPEPRSMSA